MKRRSFPVLHEHAAAASVSSLLGVPRGVILAGVVVATLAAIFFAIRTGQIERAVLVLQFMAIVATGALAWLGSTRIHRAVSRARAGVAEAAKRDSLWAHDALVAHIEALFIEYWQAVRGMNEHTLADRLDGHWRDRMAGRFAVWRSEHCKPVVLGMKLQNVSIVGLEDWIENHRDQVTALVKCFTGFHVTNMRTGEVVEGNVGAGEQMQAWRFVRGEAGWLLNRVQIVESASIGDHARVFVER
jgi:hypothetical protein